MTETARPTKSEIFSAYNRMRAQARKAGDVKLIERLNKALGILQSKAYYKGEKAVYHPSATACGCKDWEFRNAKRRQYAGPCKHMLAEILLADIVRMRDDHEVTRWVETLEARYVLESSYRK